MEGEGCCLEQEKGRLLLAFPSCYHGERYSNIAVDIKILRVCATVERRQSMGAKQTKRVDSNAEKAIVREKPTWHFSISGTSRIVWE
jgi:hypothetical protein